MYLFETNNEQNTQFTSLVMNDFLSTEALLLLALCTLTLQKEEKRKGPYVKRYIFLLNYG
jgi:hypothetical protein